MEAHHERYIAQRRHRTKAESRPVRATTLLWKVVSRPVKVVRHVATGAGLAAGGMQRRVVEHLLADCCHRRQDRHGGGRDRGRRGRSRRTAAATWQQNGQREEEGQDALHHDLLLLTRNTPRVERPPGRGNGRHLQQLEVLAKLVVDHSLMGQEDDRRRSAGAFTHGICGAQAIDLGSRCRRCRRGAQLVHKQNKTDVLELRVDDRQGRQRI